jgi:hypothetical protein
MKHLSKPTKADILLEVFNEIGVTVPVKQVCEISGIANYNSLKAMFSYIRKAKHIPDSNRIDVRIRQDQCVRVN